MLVLFLYLNGQGMKRIHKGTTLAVIFDLVALGCIAQGGFTAAALFSLGAYFLAMKEVSKYTSWYQFGMTYFSAAILGLSLDLYYLPAIPLLGVCLLATAFGSIGRISYFCKFSYTGRSWFEPLLLVLSLALYVAGNMGHADDWRGWVIPIPVFAFSFILAWGIRQDKRQLLAATMGGYKVKLDKPANDFELRDQNGTLIRLSSFRGQRHVLLIFVRGDWCPGCHMMLRTYEKNREKFQSKNIYVLAIGPDPVGVNREMVEKLGLEFKVLADENQRTAMTYGVQLREFDHAFAEKYEEGIPLPASFLVDINGYVRYVSRPDKVGEFLNPSLIFPVIDKLN